MKKILLIIIATVMVGCTTNGSSTDANAAQSLLPNLEGYDQSETNSIQDAITAAGSGAALATGNVPLAGAIAKLDQVVDCLVDTGSVASNIYLENPPTEILPATGVVLIVNESRLTENLLGCVTSVTNAQARTSSEVIEPCFGNGQLTYQGDQISYIYGGTRPTLCETFQFHFDAIQQNQGSG